MVMALSLPITVLGRTNLITLIYGAVLISLVVQGLSLSWLIQKVNISHVSKIRQQIELAQSKLISAKAAQAELLNMHNSGILSKSMYEEMRASYQVDIAEAETQLRNLSSREIDTKKTSQGKVAKLNGIKRQLLMVERSALNDAVRKRIISADIVADRIRSIDDQLMKLEY